MSKFWRSVLVFGLGFVAVISVVYLIKDIVRRPRPTQILTDYSFPSAHSASAFYVATFFSGLLYRYQTHRRGVLWGIVPVRKAQIFFYFVAVMVAYSRIYLNVHYLSDVIAGGIIGLLMGLLAVYSHQWVLPKS